MDQFDCKQFVSIMAEGLPTVASSDLVIKQLEQLVIDAVVNKNITMPLPTCNLVWADLTVIAILMNDTMPNYALVACGSPGESVHDLTETVFKHRSGVAGPFHSDTWVCVLTSTAEAKWKLICEELNIDWKKKTGGYIRVQRVPLAINLLALCKCTVSSTTDMGNVYCLSNSSIPNLHKIGFTTRNVHDRIRELSLDTPEPFTCVHKMYVYQPHVKEGIIHKILEEDRHHERREFFSTKAQRIVRLMNISDNSCGCTSPTTDDCDVQVPETNPHVTRRVQYVRGGLVATHA